MASAGSSRFAVTCGLMRKYLREQQQQGAALRPPALSFLSSAAEEADARTMQLFPARAAGTPQERLDEKTTAPLTIFYDGRVLVFEDFPADEAKALMQLAATDPVPVEKAAADPGPTEKAGAAMPPRPVAAPRRLGNQKRKDSLHRFLQKRKERIIAASDPYQKAPAEKDAKAVEDGDAASWLKL